VLVRADLNVPLDGETITDDGRVRASLPTIRALADAGARVIVAAHLGRPKGAPDPAFSLAPVAKRLGELLDQTVALAADVTGASAQSTVDNLEDSDVALLENVRFDARETSKDEAERAALADEYAALTGETGAFVSDGFGVVHRKQLLGAAGDKIVLPTDVIAADKFAADAATQTVAAEAIPDGWMGLDIGPDSVRAFAGEIAGAGTIFWNGPMGVFEMAAFAEGT